MSLKHLDLNLLVCLDALLTEQNVSRAAEKTYRSQSAMSHSLARLREIFQDELLVQIGRKMVPTPLSRELAEPVRNALLQLEAITRIRPGIDIAAVERTVSVMATDYSGIVFMPEVIRRAAREAPGVKIHLRQMDQQWPELIERGKVDMILLTRQFALGSQPCDLLFHDTHQCIAWTENALVPGDTVTREQYAGMEHVLLEYACGRTPTLNEHLLSRLGIHRRAACIAPHFAQIPFLVVGTDRIATLPRRLAVLLSRQLPLKLLPVPVDLNPVEIIVQYHQYQALDPVITWLRQLMRAVAEEMEARPGTCA